MLEWKIKNFFPDTEPKLGCIGYFLGFFLFLTIIGGYNSYRSGEIGEGVVIGVGIVAVFLLLLLRKIFLDFRELKRRWRWFKRFLEDIEEIYSQEEGENYRIQIVLKKPYEKIKVLAGRVLVERYRESQNGKKIRVRTHVFDRKEWVFEYANRLEFELPKRKMVGYMEWEVGLIEAPGIILHSPWGGELVLLFSDDSFFEEIEPDKKRIEILKHGKAFLEFSRFEDGKISFYLSVLEMGKGRAVRVELEWVYEKDSGEISISQEHLVSKVIKEVKKPGNYEAFYTFPKEERVIYVFSPLYLEDLDLDLVKITRTTNWQIYYRLVLDIPFSPDEEARGKLV